MATRETKDSVGWIGLAGLLGVLCVGCVNDQISDAGTNSTTETFTSTDVTTAQETAVVTSTTTVTVTASATSTSAASNQHDDGHGDNVDHGKGNGDGVDHDHGNCDSVDHRHANGDSVDHDHGNRDRHCCHRNLGIHGHRYRNADQGVDAKRVYLGDTVLPLELVVPGKHQYNNDQWDRRDRWHAGNQCFTRGHRLQGTGCASSSSPQGPKPKLAHEHARESHLYQLHRKD
jgi:hypothetical protein